MTDQGFTPTPANSAVGRSPQGKFVQRLNHQELEIDRLNKELESMKRWKSRLEEWMTDNFGYDPTTYDCLALPDGNRTLDDEAESNHSGLSNATFPMNHSGEDAGNSSFRNGPVNGVPRIKSVSGGGGPSTSTAANIMDRIKMEPKSPDVNTDGIGVRSHSTDEPLHNPVEPETFERDLESPSEYRSVANSVPSVVINNGLSCSSANGHDQPTTTTTPAGPTRRTPGTSIRVSFVLPGAGDSSKTKRQSVSSNSDMSGSSTPSVYVTPIITQASSKRKGIQEAPGEDPCVSTESECEPIDQTPCDICQSIVPEPGNNMLFCDSCQVCVHQGCYGVAEVPEGEWKCQTCAAGILPNTQSCRFCTNFGGAMVRVRSPSKNHWAHVSCTWWIPGPSINKPAEMDFVIGIPLVEKGRWNLLCFICKRGKGTTCCIQCRHKRCPKAFHVTCGYKEGLQMDIADDDDTESGVRFSSYCKNHGDKAQARAQVKSSPRKKRRLY